MICHMGGSLQRPAIFQIGRDAGGPERVIADQRVDARGSCPPADHGKGATTR